MYQSLEEAKAGAAKVAKTAKEHGIATAFEVVSNSRKELIVQPFGMHTLFKSHKLLHVEPIPADRGAA